MYCNILKQEVSKNFITQSRLTTTIKNMDNHEHANHRDTAQNAQNYQDAHYA